MWLGGDAADQVRLGRSTQTRWSSSSFEMAVRGASPYALHIEVERLGWDTSDRHLLFGSYLYSLRTVQRTHVGKDTF